MGLIGLNYVSFEQMKHLSKIHDTIRSLDYLNEYGADMLKNDSEIFYLVRYKGSKEEEGDIAAFIILNGNTFEGPWSYNKDFRDIHELVFRWSRANDTIILPKSMFDLYHDSPCTCLGDIFFNGKYKDGKFIYTRCRDQTENELVGEEKYEA